MIVSEQVNTLHGLHLFKMMNPLNNDQSHKYTIHQYNIMNIPFVLFEWKWKYFNT